MAKEISLHAISYDGIWEYHLYIEPWQKMKNELFSLEEWLDFPIYGEGETCF